MSGASQRWWTLVAMCLLTVMLNIDVTAINIAVPVIAREFDASLANMQWVINAYVLLSACFQIFGGKLGDREGHLKIFLIGTVLFILGSAGAGFSVNEEMLIAFRALQGLALGIAYPMTIVLVLKVFPREKQGFALSFIYATMGVSLAIGPPIGGLFVNYIGWRWIFYINVPIGIVALLMAYLCCPRPPLEKKKPLDFAGTGFLIFGLSLVILALNEVQQWGFGSSLFWIIFIVGWILLAILLPIERKAADPLINFHLFTIRNFTLNNLLRLIAQIIFVPILFFFPLYLQNIAGFSPLYTGIVMLSLTVVIGILSPTAGKWVDKVGDKLPNALAMLLFALGCFLFFFLGPTPNIWILAVGLAFIGIATGISFISTTTGSVSVAAEEDKGMATGIILTTAWIGCAIGIALMGVILAQSSHSFLASHLREHNLTLSPEQLDTAKRVAKGVDSYKELAHNFTNDTLQTLTTLSRGAFVRGFHISMLSWAALSLLGFLLALIQHPTHPAKKT